MSNFIRTLVFICLWIFLIVDLAINYGHYSTCEKPIHHWYMGFLIFFLSHRLLLIWIECFPIGTCFWVFLVIFLGPVSLIFIFAWNILGTVYLAYVTNSPDRAKCISTGTMVVDWIIISLIYLAYAFLFCIFYGVIKAIKKQKKKVEALKSKLRAVYVTMLMPEENLPKSEISSTILKVEALLKVESKELDKFPLFFEEENVMRLFYIKEINKSQLRISELKDSVKERLSSIDMSQGKVSNDDSLAEPLLQMINKNPMEEQMNKRMSDIRQNASQESEDCIICFEALDNPLKKMVLKCSHKFHEKCIFNWLKVKPNCPMCRTNIRKGLLECILEHLKKIGSSRRVSDIQEVESDMYLLNQDASEENA